MPALPAMLEVAIGMALIFLTLSMICSSLSETLSNLLDLRSKYLKQGIVALLSDPDQLKRMAEQPLPRGDFIAAVLSHPLVQKLDSEQKQSRLVQWLRGLSHSRDIRLPAYVPADAFSSALLDQLHRYAPEQGVRLNMLRVQIKELAENLQKESEWSAPVIPQPVLDTLRYRDPKRVLEQARLALPLIADTNVRTAVSNLLTAWELDEIRHGICTLPDSRVKQVLLTFIAETETEIQKVDQLKKRIENWFDDSMSQVSLWYKHHIAWFLRVFAILVCVVFNADALHIVNTLWRDPLLRQALVTQVQAASQVPVSGQPLAANGNLPQNSIIESIQAVLAQLEQLEGLPLGWNCAEFNAIVHEGYHETKGTVAPDLARDPGICGKMVRTTADGSSETILVQGGAWSWQDLLLKVIGIGLMATGVSLGSGFWYKALQQLVALREDKPKAQ